ncbi:glycosyltransferase family 9 protein [Methylophaga sp.]|jgi:ADP-heptose:LPS heptosyltransferase|uniref:glycosyltransferase family 9 protein n=1 Tax=Methylophaga sp. TaxID=2024840 RepID=UPI001400F0F1|nr:glycosyltransferase family 9 protein [Methylophaga sp.]MTI63063.1 glycosyltransferase family 9 protein [Methylophaga sp.]
MLKKTDKVLIIKHGALGDLIQSDGVLRDIREHFSDSEISLLTSPAYAALMRRCPHIDRVLTDPRASWWQWHQQRQMLAALAQEGFSRIIDLQNSDRTRLYQHWGLKNQHWISRGQGPEPESGLKGQVALLKQTGIPVEHAFYPDVSWMSANVAHLLPDGLGQSPFVALIPGCSAAHPEKRWPYYPQLAYALIAHGFEVVNILGPDEMELADDLPGFTPALEHGLLNWFELAGLLQKASFVIGNDTGPSHLASCLGRPGLALFGGETSVARAEIRRGEFRALKVNDLLQLSVETVMAAVLPRLPAPNLRPARPVPLSSY